MNYLVATLTVSEPDMSGVDVHANIDEGSRVSVDSALTIVSTVGLPATYVPPSVPLYMQLPSGVPTVALIVETDHRRGLSWKVSLHGKLLSVSEPTLQLPVPDVTLTAVVEATDPLRLSEQSAVMIDPAILTVPVAVLAVPTGVVMVADALDATANSATTLKATPRTSFFMSEYSSELAQGEFTDLM